MIKHRFIEWYFNTFAQSELFARMNDTTEDSPWHMEGSVGIHTNMVVAHYLSITPPRWTVGDLCGALCCVFHDVGKPMAEKWEWKVDKQVKKFSGHEILSARLWEDYAVTHWEELTSIFFLVPRQMYAISVMIEYHKPWDIKKPIKLKRLVQTMNVFTRWQNFVNAIQSDSTGRKSQNHETTAVKSDNWIATATNFLTDPDIPPKEGPTVTLLIGPSGCGKTTYCNQHPDAVVYSFDTLRGEWYTGDYREQFKQSCDDEDFGKKANCEYMRLLSLDADIIVDNTNLSKKRRAFFANEARNKKYNVKAVVFPISFDKLYAQTEKRTDKYIPHAVAHEHYFKLQQPLIGEFDKIEICFNR